MFFVARAQGLDCEVFRKKRKNLTGCFWPGFIFSGPEAWMIGIGREKDPVYLKAKPIIDELLKGG